MGSLFSRERWLGFRRDNPRPSTYSFLEFPRSLIMWILGEGESVITTPLFRQGRSSQTHKATKKRSLPWKKGNFMPLNHLIKSYGSLYGFKVEKFLFFHCLLYVPLP